MSTAYENALKNRVDELEARLSSPETGRRSRSKIQMLQLEALAKLREAEVWNNIMHQLNFESI